VSKKRQYNLLLPEPLINELEQLAKRFGAKKKWMLVSAGVVRLLELDDVELTEYVQRVGRAELGDAYAALIGDAKGPLVTAQVDTTHPGLRRRSPPKSKVKSASRV
jgi:hypothetical protein